MGFTYYGDLIGVTSLYRQDPEKAYKTLNEFYNTTFVTLANSSEEKVYMFSDSLVFCGENTESAIESLENLYLNLILKKNIMLRGAIVSGKLQFDPRIERTNFEKRLPRGTELVRAVCLESQYKGARFIVENALAEELLGEVRDWRTVNGYVNNITGDTFIGKNDFRRKIIPAPEGGGYEYLYFWPSNNTLKHHEQDHEGLKDKLSEIGRYPKKDISKHYSETINLLKRSLDRKRYTDSKLD